MVGIREDLIGRKIIRVFKDGVELDNGEILYIDGEL